MEIRAALLLIATPAFAQTLPDHGTLPIDPGMATISGHVPKAPARWFCAADKQGERYCWRIIPAGDGCNTCTVNENGGMVCTLLACSTARPDGPSPPASCRPKPGETVECTP
jgi:hypothetical protein